MTASSTGFAQDSESLLSLLPGSPNDFVRAVQQQLSDAGLYAGAVNGSLTRSTVTAINAACRRADVIADCQLGPLTPKGSSAVVAALDKLTAAAAPPADTAAKPADAASTAEPAVAPTEDATAPTAPATEQPPAPADISVETADQPAQPASPVPAAESVALQWHSRPAFGLTSTATVTGDTAEFAITGTAEGRGYLNIYYGDLIPTTPGTASTFTLSGSFQSPAGGVATVRLAVRRADKSYLAELKGAGTRLDGPGPFTVTGTAPAEAAFVQPYVQVAFPPGTPADGTLTLGNGTVTQ